jgi:hypothetical protein
MSAQQIADEGHWPMMPELAAAIDKKLSVVDRDRLRLWANGVYLAGGNDEWAKQKRRIEEADSLRARLAAAEAERDSLRAACERARRVVDKWPHRKNALHPHIETLQVLDAALARRPAAE